MSAEKYHHITYPLSTAAEGSRDKAIQDANLAFSFSETQKQHFRELAGYSKEGWLRGHQRIERMLKKLRERKAKPS